ncbi:Hint domain-containing protein [Vitiosangium sp. GDMCC 1.1324]|uniref:Hint domain-containing protein n=1 Tax=Vitiosangium sp. (strain GDMCC 1.1324) TaxID=2138576 RepID=UPI000D381165|nr:Hint domain-containing protein [Vitiosangium sp. GDMCC 1.1324]PTL75312.1 hypothetical protein DAT35_55760 [Vitiosangium sp. GDMCC 1.1324]
MRALLVVAVLAVTGVSSTAMAQHTARCTLDDQLTTAALGAGRNAWARKCGFITAAKEAVLNEEGEYQVFLQGCYSYPNVVAGSSCTRYVPASESEACIPLDQLAKLGSCPVGCFTPTQKVAFNGKRTEIPEAYRAGERTVTALSQNATLDAPAFGEQSIRTYVSGDTDEDVFALKTADGRIIEVTADHPLVDGEGNIVKAKTLKLGDKLLASNGKQVPITEVTVFRFKGYVWNVQPVSHEKIENILDVEGLLTGSIRFQNEWADIHYRLGLRDEANVQGL